MRTTCSAATSCWKFLNFRSDFTKLAKNYTKHNIVVALLKKISYTSVKKYERRRFSLIDRLSENIADFFVDKNVIDYEDKNVYQYGFSLILNDIVTFSLILIFSACFFKLRFGIEFLSVFCTTRIFTGGYHARKAYLCKISTLSAALCVLSLSELIKALPIYYITAMLVISFITVLPFIPVKHPNKELTPELIKRGKTGGIISYALFSVAGILFYTYTYIQDASIIALSLFTVSVFVIIGKFTNERGENK